MRYTFEDLCYPKRCKDIEHVPGFYKVYLPEGFELKIANETRANKACFSDSNQMRKAYLEGIWNELLEYGADKDRLLYIGEGIDVKRRLGNYKNVMFNNATNHSGGVYICQIVDCQILEIEWEPHLSHAVDIFLDTPKDLRKQKSPVYENVKKELRQKESDMIQEYAQNHGGLLPFANRK